MSTEGPLLQDSIAAPARTLRVAIIGQPNVGKSSLFNRLTGLRQRVGNYPGVTVERKQGTGRIGDTTITFADLPGTYSLNALSPDEHVSVRALAGHPDTAPVPDVIVCVLDAGKLQRSLLPAFQAAALSRPMVLALNFFDEATAEGWKFDLARLEKNLGIPVVPTVGHKGEGNTQLKEAILRSHAGRMIPRPLEWPEEIQKGIDHVAEQLEVHAGGDTRQFRAQRLVFDVVPAGEVSAPSCKEAVAEAHRLIFQSGHVPSNVEMVLLFPAIRQALEGCVEKTGTVSRRWTERLDAVCVHPVFGIAVFALIMFGIFQAVYSWASPLMDLIETGTGSVQGWVGPWLDGSPILQSLVVDGILAGIGGVIVFLPQILILTALIALLEDCGYLARAAFLIDRSLSWCGLSGKSFVPLMSGFACAIPAIMAARTIEDPKSRLTTILITPLMSCSARLPVYVLLIGAFIEPRYGALTSAAVLFAMHMIGPFLGLPAAWILQHRILKAPAQPFILELPPYRRPTLRDTLWRLWHRTSRFLTDAGTIILAMSVIIWALLYFPRSSIVETNVRAEITAEMQAENLPAPDIEAAWADPESDLSVELEERLAGAYVEQSYLGRFGKWVQPVFAPAGFDWKITVGVLASFPAREVIISTLGIIYHLGSDEDEESPRLRDQLARERVTDGPRAGEPVFTVPVAAAIMVFFAICMQCGATIAMMTSELNWRWAWGSFAVMTLLAWLGAVGTFQLLSRLL